MRQISLIAGFCLAIWQPAVSADDQQARVFKVLDGDRILVRTRARSQRLQIAGIDAPERLQPGGDFSVKVLEKMVLGKRVAIQIHGENAMGDPLVTLRYRKYDIGLEMVKAGAAWASPTGGEALREAQAQARAASKGIWSAQGSEPVAPWVWRSEQY